MAGGFFVIVDREVEDPPLFEAEEDEIFTGAVEFDELFFLDFITILDEDELMDVSDSFLERSVSPECLWVDDEGSGFPNSFSELDDELAVNVSMDGMTDKLFVLTKVSPFATGFCVRVDKERFERADTFFSSWFWDLLGIGFDTEVDPASAATFDLAVELSLESNNSNSSKSTTVNFSLFIELLLVLQLDVVNVRLDVLLIFYK